jgi:hypothetical protein
MTTAEFSRQFDVRFNNIDSNLAHGVTEYEKSLYLTQAQLEIVKNYFNPKGNKYQEGFDGSPKRDIDFSNIIKVQAIGTGTQADTTGAITDTTEFGIKTLRVRISDNIMMLLNERFSFNGAGTPSVYSYDTTVVPIDYKQYQTVLGKAYKDPPLRQTWRFIRGGAITVGASTSLDVELITKSNFDIAQAYVYYVRYLKRPQPIILENLSAQHLTIENVATVSECELSPELHEEILGRAIEICKADYTGDLNSQIELNKRNE